MAEVRDITELYRLGRVLKSSPGGIVFRATDPGIGRQVAIKLINRGTRPDQKVCRQRFTAAVRTLQSLQPACFPRVFDFGFTPDGSAFMVLELVDGSLAEALAGSSPARILPLLGPVIDGLEVLAAQGIAHHNLAPENLLLARGRDGEEIRVLGFGTAAYRWPPETGRPRSALSAGFQAPEFDGSDRNGEEPDWRADVYSLSLVICHLLGAEATPPDCPAITLPAAIRAGLHDSDELCTLLLSGLRRNPEERPTSYHAMRHAVSVALSGHAPAAREPEKTELIRLPRDLVEGPGPAGAVIHPPVEPTIAIRIRGLAAKKTPPTVLSARPLEPTMAFQIQPEAPPVAVSPEAASVPAEVSARPWPSTSTAADDGADEGFGRTIAIQIPVAPAPQKSVESAAPRTEPAACPAPWPVPESSGGPRVGSQAPPVEPEAVAPPMRGDAVACPLSPAQDEHEGRPSPSPEMPPPAPMPGTMPPPPPMPGALAPVVLESGAAFSSAPAETPGAAAKDGGPGEVGPSAGESAAALLTAIQVPPPSPTRRTRMPWWPLFLIIPLALALVVGGIFVGSRMVASWVAKPAPTPVAIASPTPAPRAAPPTGAPQLIQDARRAFDSADFAGARKSLKMVTPADEDRLSRADYDRLRALREKLAAQRAGSLARDLDRGVRTGNVDLLRQTLAAATRDDLGATSMERRTALQLEVARRAVDLEARLVTASRGRNNVGVIRTASALLAVLPACAEAVDLRGHAAAAMEKEADVLVGNGQFDAGIARLEELRTVWAARPGLDRRIEQCRSEAEAERTMSAVLAEVAQAERDRQPERGLELLRGAKVSGTREARLAEARGRLERLLVELDREAPIIRLKPGWKAEFEKGKAATVPLHVTDDHAVKTVSAWARIEGGTAYSEVVVRHLAGSDYVMDVPVAFHRNETIELFVTAIDASGHVGRLGRADAPIQVKRKHWLF